MTVKAKATNKLGRASLADLKSALSSKISPGEPYHPLFRTALDAIDPASRFLGLYWIPVIYWSVPGCQDRNSAAPCFLASAATYLS
jgi:hypothetical protein